MAVTPSRKIVAAVDLSLCAQTSLSFMRFYTTQSHELLPVRIKLGATAADIRIAKCRFFQSSIAVENSIHLCFVQE
jgi:hypothetical protein